MWGESTKGKIKHWKKESVSKFFWQKNKRRMSERQKHIFLSMSNSIAFNAVTRRARTVVINRPPRTRLFCYFVPSRCPSILFSFVCVKCAHFFSNSFQAHNPKKRKTNSHSSNCYYIFKFQNVYRAKKNPFLIIILLYDTGYSICTSNKKKLWKGPTHNTIKNNNNNKLTKKNI